MDPFTHSFGGLALGNFSSSKSRSRFLIALVVSALLPDIDGALLLFSNSIQGHRLATHSLPFGALLAVACSLILYFAFKRRISICPLLVACVSGILIHLLLDSLVVWGVPLFYPFNNTFYSFDLYLTVLDPYLILSYLLLFLAFVFSKLGLLQVDPKKAIALVSIFALIILASRFLFQFQASRITTLKGPTLVPMNEDFNDFFFQRHWKAISSSNGEFRVETIDILRHTILNRLTTTKVQTTNPCPLFTQEYLYTENGRIGDIRYTNTLLDDPRLPQNCLFGQKI